MIREENVDVLDRNLRRLFDRATEGGRLSDAKRAQTLALLREQAAPPLPRSRVVAGRRWPRWGSLAAGLLLASGLLLRSGSGVPTAPAVGRQQGGAPAQARSGEAMLVSFAIQVLEAPVGVASADTARPLPQRYVSNADVESTSVVRDGSSCSVRIQMTAEGARKLAKLTREHIGERLALVVDGKVEMAPTIRSEIRQGLVVLSGKFSESRCEEIAGGMVRR